MALGSIILERLANIKEKEGCLQGCAMAQAVSCQPLTAEAWVHAWVSLCGICEGQGGTGTGFSPSSLVFPCQYHSTMAFHTHVSSGR
jgi:hypothetical protein